MNYPRRFSSNEYERRNDRNNDARGSKGQRRSVQDYILGRCRSRNIPLEISLKNEIKIIGKIVAFDNWTIYLDEGKGHILIFKSGILSLKPLKPIDTRNILSYPSDPDLKLKDDKSPYFFDEQEIA